MIVLIFLWLLDDLLFMNYLWEVPHDISIVETSLPC